MYTNVHFDCGGCYSESEAHEWISGKTLHGISIKTSSLEDITYSVLVEKICRKIAIDETTGKLKLSYSLSNARIQSDIVDDEDVFVYLTSLDNEGLKPVLHVELLNDAENNQRLDQHSKVGQGSSVGVNYGRVDEVEDVGNVGMITVYRGGGTAEEQNEPVIEELRDNVEEENVEDENVGNVGNDDSENVARDEFADVDASRDEYVALPASEQGSQYVEEWEDGTGLEIKQEFCSRQALQDLVLRAANKNCFGYVTKKSDTGRLMLRCRQASEGCKWYLLATRTKNSERWSIRIHRKMHTCSRAVASTSGSKKKGSQRLVAALLHQSYPGRMDTPPAKSIINLVQQDLSMECSYSTALRGKKRHVSEVRGSPEKSYKLLFPYLYELEKANPGTVTYVELDLMNRFKYLFIALGASIEGFRAMRKVIVVDATFLRTTYGGVLVFATAQDPNHHHYPIAFGVIDAENHLGWNWFFTKLKTVIPDVPELVFISDRHQSIINAVETVYPSAKHAHCIWHLSQNVRVKVSTDKDGAAEKFRECAHAYTESGFSREWSDFKSRFPTAASYLEVGITFDKWARFCFEGDKYNIDTSNSAESMNSVFRKARTYPLLPMIDAIVEKISEWFNKHRLESTFASDFKRVVPYVENILHERCATAIRLSVFELNGYQLEYDVKGVNGKSYLVDLKNKSCACKCFDIDKYPCVHAIAAARHLMRKELRTTNIHIYDLCSKYYLIETWALAYYRTIYLVPHESDWIVPAEVQELFALPPLYTKKQGRNQETRYPSTGERRRKKKKNKSVPGINLERWLQPENP